MSNEHTLQVAKTLSAEMQGWIANVRFTDV